MVEEGSVHRRKIMVARGILSMKLSPYRLVSLFSTWAQRSLENKQWVAIAKVSSVIIPGQRQETALKGGSSILPLVWEFVPHPRLFQIVLVSHQQLGHPEQSNIMIEWLRETSWMSCIIGKNIIFNINVLCNNDMTMSIRTSITSWTGCLAATLTLTLSLTSSSSSSPSTAPKSLFLASNTGPVGTSWTLII